MKSQGHPSVKQQDNIDTSNTLDEVENLTDELDPETVRVTADASYDAITGIDSTDGTNHLADIDDTDSINQLANMDNVASRKGMRGLQDTVDMRNTDEINELDYLDSSADIGYSEEEEQQIPYRLQCPHCHYEFIVAYVIVHDDMPVTCPHCSKVFESEAHVIGQA
ncbi:hypothetical protein RHO15_06415 [Utexia brackfieldae]|uniref:hypothetical protein n=1 Tax=Utexia brackfieldae TaxID=3074108 RepID=UPI00370DB28B